MADITYCINGSCPFKDCERHSSRVDLSKIDDAGYVSVANFDGVCKRYLSYLLQLLEGETNE